MKLAWQTFLLTLVFSVACRADITITMHSWEFLPEVVISQGRSQSCSDNRVIFGPAPMASPFSQTFEGTGSEGEELCWRRTADPLNSASDLGPWTRCPWDGECEIQ